MSLVIADCLARVHHESGQQQLRGPQQQQQLRGPVDPPGLAHPGVGGGAAGLGGEVGRDIEELVTITSVFLFVLTFIAKRINTPLSEVG